MVEVPSGGELRPMSNVTRIIGGRDVTLGKCRALLVGGIGWAIICTILQ